jgi:hypothetical protein
MFLGRALFPQRRYGFGFGYVLNTSDSWMRSRTPELHPIAITISDQFFVIYHGSPAGKWLKVTVLGAS